MQDNTVEHDYDRIWALLYEASHMIYRLQTKELKPLGLHPRQVGALLYLQNSDEPMTAAQMARLQLRGRNSVSVLLNRMEKEGLISRTQDPKNKKRQRLFLTHKGEKTRLAIEGEKTIPTIFSALSETECQSLTSCLEKLLDRVDELHKSDGMSRHIQTAGPNNL
jgi:DNA-binding MarR family transcriptional regulator